MKVSRLIIQIIAILFGLSFLIWSVLLINTLVTVPGTPISYRPAALFSNFIFAMELGFSLPFPPNLRANFMAVYYLAVVFYSLSNTSLFVYVSFGIMETDLLCIS